MNILYACTYRATVHPSNDKCAPDFAPVLGQLKNYNHRDKWHHTTSIYANAQRECRSKNKEREDAASTPNSNSRLVFNTLG